MNEKYQYDYSILISNSNLFMRPTIQFYSSFNFNFIRRARISANLLLACVVAFCKSRRILQFEDTVRQSRYQRIDTHYSTISTFLHRALSVAYGSLRVCLSVLISITAHLHNRRSLIALV